MVRCCAAITDFTWEELWSAQNPGKQRQRKEGYECFHIGKIDTLRLEMERKTGSEESRTLSYLLYISPQSRQAHQVAAGEAAAWGWHRLQDSFVNIGAKKTRLRRVELISVTFERHEQSLFSAFLRFKARAASCFIHIIGPSRVSTRKPHGSHDDFLNGARWASHKRLIPVDLGPFSRTEARAKVSGSIKIGGRKRIDSSSMGFLMCQCDDTVGHGKPFCIDCSCSG